MRDVEGSVGSCRWVGKWQWGKAKVAAPAGAARGGRGERGGWGGNEGGAKGTMQRCACRGQYAMSHAKGGICDNEKEGRYKGEIQSGNARGDAQRDAEGDLGEGSGWAENAKGAADCGGGGEVLGGGGGQRGLQRWLQRETCRGVARRIQMGAVCSASLRNRQHPPRHPNGNSSDSFSCQGHCLPLNIRCGNPDNSCGLETKNNAYFGCFVHAY